MAGGLWNTGRHGIQRKGAETQRRKGKEGLPEDSRLGVLAGGRRRLGDKRR